MIRRYESQSDKTHLIKNKRGEKDNEASKIKILGAWKGEPLTFDSAEEFEEYLSDHRDEMMKYKTNMLNKMYKIQGYRITVLKEHGISLRPDKTTTDPDKYELLVERVNDLDKKIQAIINHLSRVEQ